jgi:hypothetical protein
MAVMDLDLSPFIRMLQEDGIYDWGDSTSEIQTEEEQDPTAAPVNLTNGNSNGTTSDTPKAKNRAPWETEIRTLLHTDHQQAIHRLKHLPIEIPSLDFLTDLITDGTLSSLSIDPSPIIRDFLQRSLRIVELMTEPPPANDPLYSEDTKSVNGNGHSSEVPDDYGKPAQERAVKLLLLFIGNLIREGLVPANEMFFEIQEICVRYIFIKEVRDFKAEVEGTGLRDMDGGK